MDMRLDGEPRCDLVAINEFEGGFKVRPAEGCVVVSIRRVHSVGDLVADADVGDAEAYRVVIPAGNWAMIVEPAFDGKRDVVAIRRHPNCMSKRTQALIFAARFAQNLLFDIKIDAVVCTAIAYRGWCDG